MPDVISVSALENDLAGPRGCQLVDVRTSSEYATGHIPGAMNIPMEQIEGRTRDLGREPIVLICKGGKRATMVAGHLQGCGKKLVVLEGGTDAWREAGFAVVSSVGTRWSLERQVRAAVGTLILAGIVLSLLANPRWIYFSGFLALGMTFAGLTDICLMGALLSRLPWNVGSQCRIRHETAVTDLRGVR